MIQALVLVDIDGTLLRVDRRLTRQLWAQSWEEVIGGTIPWQRLQSAAGKTDLQILAELLGDSDAACAVAPSFFDVLAERAHDMLTPNSIERCPGAEDFLNTAVLSGVLLAVLSGNEERCGWLKLQRAGLDSYFAAGFFGGNALERTELPPRALRWAREGYKILPETPAIIVGDTPNDIACAREHNLHVFAVATGPYTFEQLAMHQPTVCVRHLGQAVLSLHTLVNKCPMARLPIIAIDGPAGSGKTTTARLLAERLGYTYIDTGAMYRALTLAALEEGIPLEDHALAAFVRRSRIELRHSPQGQRTYLDGRDVTERIRMPDVTAHVSVVSSFPSVREAMVRLQQQMGSRGGVVMDGRDIGTAVFPDADVKVYMTADLDTRAVRRLEELRSTEPTLTLEDVKEQLDQRDQFDSAREFSPLRRADDAIVIDTTNLTIEEQVERIMQYIRNRTVQQSASTIP